ncbi:MAG TPA: IS110 family transposase [Mycobacterium sp.]|nr:IS110 family transposase [Mycobacterium sp.]HTY31271.1 IS110 family transposase [Mycobacterium sp.]
MPIATCGIDWAQDHHDVAIVDTDGQLLAKRRIPESIAGFTELTAMLAEAGDNSSDPIPVAIETPRGLLVAVLRASGRPVYPINPMSVARYRERTSMSGKKSDHGDAVTLANILRTDADQHRRLAADTELAQSITVLARAHQDATWRRTRASNELRSLLREYFPGFLHTFADRPGAISSAEARAVLAIAPTPAKAARLTKPQIVAALRRAGRHRGMTSLAATIQQRLRTPQLRHPTLVEDAFGIQALAVLATLDAEYDSVDRLGEATAAACNEDPDHQIITSFIGLADLTGARLLAEIGDDRTRFADARALKVFAGSAPVTKASGRSIRITHRHVKYNRLAAVGFVWAFVASGCQGPTRAHYLARRDHGDRHPAALRHLYNRMLGQLYHCLQTAKPTTRSRPTDHPHASRTSRRLTLNKSA